MCVSRGREGINVEISRVSVTGVGGAVHRGQGVSVHQNISRLICVQAGGGCCGGCGPSESPSPTSTTAPSSRGLLGALRFGPACGSGTRG